MNKRDFIPGLVSVCSLLLAPRALAQQELIDRQPEPGAESQSRPSWTEPIGRETFYVGSGMAGRMCRLLL